MYETIFIAFAIVIAMLAVVGLVSEADDDYNSVS